MLLRNPFLFLYPLLFWIHCIYSIWVDLVRLIWKFHTTQEFCFVFDPINIDLIIMSILINILPIFSFLIFFSCLNIWCKIKPLLKFFLLIYFSWHIMFLLGNLFIIYISLHMSLICRTFFILLFITVLLFYYRFRLAQCKLQNFDRSRYILKVFIIWTGLIPCRVDM